MKLFKFIVTIVFLVVFIDILFGLVTRLIVNKVHLRGDYESIDYVMTQANEDVLVLGSSVALNSFVPTIFTESTGLTSYNAASNAQNFTFFETITDCILKRTTPKMLILGIRPSDLTGVGIGDRFNIFAPYYGQGYPLIDHYMNSKNSYDKYLLKSNLYRYNTIWWRILLYFFVTPSEPGEKGYIAKGIPLIKPEIIHERADSVYTERRVKSLLRIISLCEAKGVKLVVFCPPMYTVFDPEGVMPIPMVKLQEICKQHHIPFFYDTQDQNFLKRPDLFYDNEHLNKLGAPIYTKQLIHEMKEAGIKF